jgi:hypothetical protein
MKYCMHCGAELPEYTELFCPSCGAKALGGRTPAVGGPTAAGPPSDARPGAWQESSSSRPQARRSTRQPSQRRPHYGRIVAVAALFILVAAGAIAGAYLLAREREPIASTTTASVARSTSTVTSVQAVAPASTTQQSAAASVPATSTTEELRDDGSSPIAGTRWTGVVALTGVTVTFEGGMHYTSSHFGSGSYSIDHDQVSLVPSANLSTRVFVLNGSLMQGTVDGWPCTLTKQ